MKGKILIATFILGLLVSVIIFSCGKSGNSGYTYTTPPPVGNTAAISMKNIMFSPAIDTVAVGTVVTWTNEDGVTHTATSDDGTSFNSGDVTSGSKFSYTASVAGTFAFHCKYHQSMGMVGTLVVK